jgi:hypothetical protein
MFAIFVVGVVLVAFVGATILITAPTTQGWLAAVMGRFHRARDAVAVELGRYVGALFVLIAGAGVAFIIGWPFGRIARRYKPNIDAPFLRWTKKHVRAHGAWHHLNALYTHLGNHNVTTSIYGIAAVLFALLWIKRGWWIPPLVFAAALGFEKFGQAALGKVADRPPVPQIPDLGTYPSGGCARFVVEFGILWFMTCATFPQISRRVRVIGYTVVAVGAFIEGYTRIYLIKHWMMDVLGGWLFGSLLLIALIGAVHALVQRQPARA